MRKFKIPLSYYRVSKGLVLRKLLSVISMIMIVAYLNLIVGCRYYRVNTVDPLSDASIVEQVQNKEKYIILHHGDTVWHLAGITLNEPAKVIEGFIQPLPLTHSYYKTAKKEGKANTYHSVEKINNPVFEVHLYVTELNPGGNSQVSIPFTDINKVQVYDRHTGATAFSIIGITLVVVGVVAIIIAATKSSCPFVYTDNGDGYTFIGEMYGGAIYPTLERDDYMPLPGYKPIDGLYYLRISNELLERQYTNLANLLVVEHPGETRVLLDKEGQIQTITNPEIPFLVKSGTGIDCRNQVAVKDSSSFLFDHDLLDKKDMSSLIIHFKRPEKSTTGKLILNAKNSFWLDYVYGKFNEQFGTYYNTFADQQKKVPARKHIQWGLEQNIPLSVYVENKGVWKFADYVNPIGPLASRDIVIPIDLSDVEGEEVRIKLECGFMFWELDYVALDFSENIPVKITEIIPSSAVDEKGKNVSGLIAATDSRYLIQPAIGNVATVQYPAITPADGNSQTVFLHSRGYYEYIREYKNWPDVRKLLSFKQKGSFTKFSKEQYTEFIQNDELLAAALTQRNEN